MSKAHLLWIDLEMTGLDPEKDKIVEIGAIATDFSLNEIARYESGVQVDAPTLRERMVGDFWTKSRVKNFTKIAQNGQTSQKVEDDLLAFLQQNFNTTQPIYLAGNSIHQDQKFIARAWPRLAAKLHYRQLDVSSFKIIFENRGIKFQKPEAHRATSDIEGSIQELKFYLERITFGK